MAQGSTATMQVTDARLLVQLKLQLLPTGQPTVLLDVEPRRPGGHRLRLHSGVRLVNATDLYLRIGCMPSDTFGRPGHSP